MNQDRPTRLVLLARPGAGKSTQARLLAGRLGVVHVATGALLRREVAASSTLGNVLAPLLDRGDLAPDELVEAIVTPALERAVAAGGYVLDGYPRNLAQARALTETAPGRLDPQVVLSLEVDALECRRRLLERASRERRSDDTPGVIAQRLAVYERDTAPVLEYYRSAGILVPVDGHASPEVVTGRILTLLGLA